MSGRRRRGGGGRKSGGNKQGKRNISASAKKKGGSGSSNRKRFVGKFPHIPVETSTKYFHEHGFREGVKMLTDFDFKKNFKKQYYDKFRRVKMMNRHDDEEGEEHEGEVEPSRRKSKCTFREIKGDLFSSPKTRSLCHCVSRDLKMSAGIAVLFVKKFGRKDELINQKKKVGEIAILTDTFESKGYEFTRCIFYMITKERFFHIPSYENLFKTLKEMRMLCERFGIKKLNMPRIACGLDRLKWKYVKEMIMEVFFDYEIEITCYYL